MPARRTLTVPEIITFMLETDDEAKVEVWKLAEAFVKADMPFNVAFSDAIHLVTYGE